MPLPPVHPDAAGSDNEQNREMLRVLVAINGIAILDFAN